MRHFSADVGGFTTTMEVLVMTAGMDPGRFVPRLKHLLKPRDHEEIPIGSLIETPSGRQATVEGYRGYGRRGGADRGHRIWLVCRYTDPVNKRFDVVQLLPELAKVLRYGAERNVA